MKKFLKYSLFSSAAFVFPVVAFAQVQAGGIMNLLDQLQLIISRAIPVLIGLAVLAFSWGIVVYLFTMNKDKGKEIMIWGIIAIFVMTSVWGLVGILRGTIFGTSPDAVQNIPLPSAQ